MLDNNHSQDRTRNREMILVWIVGFSLLLTACDGVKQDKTFTIGVVSYVSIHAPVIELSITHKYFDSTSPLSSEFTFSLLTFMIYGVQKMVIHTQTACLTLVSILHTESFRVSAYFSSFKDMFLVRITYEVPAP